MPVYVKKYIGSNYFESREYVDGMTINTLPGDAFPIFRYETEDVSSVGTYRGGDFDISVDLVNPATSTAGLNVKDFFLGTQRNYYYLVCIIIGDQSFCGIAQQSQISADFTYSKNPMRIRITCKDILIEWSKRCSIVANSTINIANGDARTFEEYIFEHFSGITSGVVLIGLPATSFLSRLLPYGNPVSCQMYGDYLNFITNQQSISRWETFKELAKGLGFNFEMYINPGTELTNEPEFIFNIFFIEDLANADPMTIEVIEHREFTTAPRLEWLFLKYRSIVLSGIDYSSGIFFNSLGNYYSDTDNFAQVLYPCCNLSLSDRILQYIDINVVSQQTILRDVDFVELELKQYNYDLSTGGSIGKLFPLDEADGGGMAYARIFNCISGSGTNIDTHDFNPIQRYVINNYYRYLKGLQKGKNLLIPFNINSTVKTWKTLIANDGNGDEKYYISGINGIDLAQQIAEIEGIKLIEAV